MRRGDVLTTVRDAYPGVAIHPRFGNHFIIRHRFAGNNFDSFLRYKVLPFGVHDAPRAYTILLRPVMAFLASGPTRVRLAKLLDDIMIAASSEKQSVLHTQHVIAVLQWLGFVLHSDKVELTGSQRREFLGLLWDTQAFVLRLTPKRLSKVCAATGRLCGVLRARLRMPMRFLASVLGQCLATRDAVAVAPLLCREQLRWLRGSLACQVHALGLHSTNWDFNPEDPYLPPELWDFDAIRANAGRGKKRPDHWSHKVDWRRDVFQLLSPEFTAARAGLLCAELLFWSCSPGLERSSLP